MAKCAYCGGGFTKQITQWLIACPCLMSSINTGAANRHRSRVTPTIEAEHFSTAPLRAYVEERSKSRTMNNIAFDLGMTTRSLQRLVNRPYITAEAADDIAIRLGLHPVLLWPEQWEMSA